VKHASRKRVIGIGSAWIAAYALVLNVILSSVFLAALSSTAFAADHTVCANSADIGAVRDDMGKSDKKAAIHCPMCIGKHAASALPPPPDIVFVDRTAVPVSLAFAFDAAGLEPKRVSDHQPRGPPSLT
jgi:hypothetical protein